MRPTLDTPTDSTVRPGTLSLMDYLCETPVSVIVVVDRVHHSSFFPPLLHNRPSEIKKTNTPDRYNRFTSRASRVKNCLLNPMSHHLRYAISVRLSGNRVHAYLQLSSPLMPHAQVFQFRKPSQLFNIPKCIVVQIQRSHVWKISNVQAV
jgi:hypothetical protein